MTQKDSLFSDDDVDDFLFGVDQAFEQGNVVAEPEDFSVLPIDEESVDFLVESEAMTEPDARKYVHDTRHLMRSMGVADTTKIDFSLTK